MVKDYVCYLCNKIKKKKKQKKPIFPFNWPHEWMPWSASTSAQSDHNLDTVYARKLKFGLLLTQT